MMGKKIITKENLIKIITKNSNNDIFNVKNFYNILEDTLFDLLSSTNEDNDICIKLFEGISLDGKFIHEEIKKNNLTGETITVPSHIKPKFNITRTYREKLNDK